MEKTVEQQLFGAFLGSDSAGVSRYLPEQFVPRPGNVLVVMAPKIKRVGNIELPEDSQQQPNYGRVCAVPAPKMTVGAVGSAPEEYKVCPFNIGDVVLLQDGAGVPIEFRDERGRPRTDLRILQYTDGIESEIIGVLLGDPVPVEDVAQEENSNGRLVSA